MKDNISDQSGQETMFTIQRLCKINKIEIENPQNWEVVGNLKKLINDKFIPDKGGHTTTSSEYNKEDDLVEEKEEGENKIIINEMVEIIEHAPVAFQQIKEWDGIKNEDIKLSLHPDFNRDNVFKAGES